MYNNIGLKTVRGSGTNGYIQTNLAALPANWKRFRGRRRGFDGDEPEKKPKVYRPSQELIDHNKKRAVEVKVFEYREKLEEQDFEEENIEEKVAAYRKYMQEKMAAGEFDEQAQYCGHNNTLQGEKLTRGEKLVEQKKKNLKMQRALGITGDHVHGKAFDQDLQLKEKNERLATMEQGMTTEEKIAFREQNYLDRLEGREAKDEPLHRPGPTERNSEHWRGRRSNYRDRMDERRGGGTRRREFSRSGSRSPRRKRRRSRSPDRRERRRKRSRSRDRKDRDKEEESSPRKVARWKPGDSEDEDREKSKKKRKKDKKKKKKRRSDADAQDDSDPGEKRKKKKKKKSSRSSAKEEGELNDVSGGEENSA